MAYYNKAWVHHKLRQYEQAIDNLDEAIRLDPQHSAAYNNRAIAARKLGKSGLAEQDDAKAKELSAE